MKTNHLQKIVVVMAVTDLLLSAFTAQAQYSPAPNVARPAAARVFVPQPFSAGHVGAETPTNATPASATTTTVKQPKLLWLAPPRHEKYRGQSQPGRRF